MKLKKFITLGLAAVMATSAIGINAIAADSDNEIVYSYADENNNIINITQSDLDAEHWNKEALGDTAPAIYDEFSYEYEQAIQMMWQNYILILNI